MSAYGSVKKKKFLNSASPYERVLKATAPVMNEPARRSTRANMMRSCSEVPLRGVKVVQLKGLRHSAFITSVNGFPVCFDSNDSSAGLTADGFENEPYSEMERPFCQRKVQLDQRGAGQCLNISNALSTYWFKNVDKSEEERLEAAIEMIKSAKNAVDLVSKLLS